MIPQKIFSISQINKYIKGVFDKDIILSSVFVKGEISNFKASFSGHLYFTLKDADSSIKCVMFKGSADILPFELKDGMMIIACGYVSVYEKTGDYQFYCELIDPIGIGSLAAQFEELKKKFLEEGLFDPDYKREINKFPNAIGVITSPYGAAVCDIIKTIKRRNNSVKIVVVPTVVQGNNAPSSIVNSIRAINRYKNVDTIILGRGGGSIEDLWAFNDENVCKAIFASRIPVISAVGHESDFTISDFVSDLRASTPTAAAELAVLDNNTFYENYASLNNRLNKNMLYKIDFQKNRLENLLNRAMFKRPLELINNKSIHLDNVSNRIKINFLNKLELSNLAFLKNVEKLENLSPLSVLSRGYSVVYKDDLVLSDAKNLNVGDDVKIRFKENSVYATVKGVLELDEK